MGKYQHLTLYYTLTVDLVAIVPYSLIVHQFLTNRSFRNPYNFFCFFRSLVFLSWCIVDAVGFVALMREKFLLGDILNFINSVLCYYMLPNEIVFAFNRLVAMIFWNQYAQVFKTRNNVILAVFPLLMGSGLVFWNVAIGCRHTLDKVSYRIVYREHIGDCYHIDEIQTYFFMIPLVIGAFILNSITFSALCKYWWKRRKSNKGLSSKVRAFLRTFCHSVLQSVLSIILMYYWMNPDIFPLGTDTFNNIVSVFIVSSCYQNMILFEGIVLVFIHKKALFRADSSISIADRSSAANGHTPNSILVKY